jgi:hypothetical protein
MERLKDRWIIHMKDARLNGVFLQKGYVASLLTANQVDISFDSIYLNLAYSNKNQYTWNTV